MSKPTKHTMIVASHAHWDREWYAVFQEFRMRLVDLIDEAAGLLEDQESRFVAYNLDGQAVVAEDYLEIKPDAVERLRRHVSSRRLLVGPWYILPDEFLVSGEALVRNLLRGKRIAERLGHFPNVGYLPDCFGHVAQIPQILLGFGVDNIVFWRGLGLERPAPEMFWRSPDGTKVFGCHMVEGYGNVCTSDKKTYREKLDLFRERIEFHRAYSRSGLGLLMHGVDHAPVDPDVVKIIDDLNREYDDMEFRHGSFEDYIDLLRERQCSEWPTFDGMLRDTKRHEKTGAVVLNGILSARIYLKQANADCEIEMARWAEPMAAIDRLMFGGDRRGFLDNAWMWLLRNQPHDSIGGCSIDRVHQQMMTRFQWCRDISDSVCRRVFHKLTCGEASERKDYRIAVFNPMPFAVSDLVEADIPLVKTEWEPIEYADGARFDPQKTIRSVRLAAQDGTSIAAELVGVTDGLEYYPNVRECAPFRNAVKARVRFWADDLPAMGYRQFRVMPLNAHPARTVSLLTDQRTMENEHLTVRVEPNGTLTVTDKASGKTFQNLLYFEDGGDVGDEYNYSPPMKDQVVTTLGGPAQISVLHDGPGAATLGIEYVLSIPAEAAIDREGLELRDRNGEFFADRAARRVELPIRGEVTLGKAARFIRVKVTVDNQARDHRLRAMFPTGLAAERVSALQQFDVDSLPVMVEPVDPKVWTEDQPEQYPHHGFVDMADERNGLAVFARGLPEFEVTRDAARAIAITLLRCVGRLSRGHFLTRGEHAGPVLATPEAQCFGRYEFDLAVYPHAASWPAARVLEFSQQFLAGLKTFTPLPSLAAGDGSMSLLSLDAQGVMIDALKPAEDGQSTVLRLTNYTGETQKVVLTLNFPFEQVRFARLDETVLDEGPARNGKAITLEIESRKIVTLAIA